MITEMVDSPACYIQATVAYIDYTQQGGWPFSLQCFPNLFLH